MEKNDASSIIASYQRATNGIIDVLEFTEDGENDIEEIKEVFKATK